MNIYALARSILTRALLLILHFGQQFLRHFRDSSLSILIHRKNQQSNIYLDDSFPITNLRILYIYTHIQSNDKTSYRRTLDIERIDRSRRLANDWLLPPRLTDFCPETSYYRESNPDIAAISAPLDRLASSRR